MGLGDFWLQFNNGKKERLSDIKGDIRRETVDKKYQKIFDFFDANKNGAIEGKEAEQFINVISKFAGDKVLTKAEASSIFAELGIKDVKDVDFIDFVKGISEANKKIKTSDESILPDGSRKVVTNYTNGARLTAVYYPDGELKYTIKELPSRSTNISSNIPDVKNGAEVGFAQQNYSVTHTQSEMRKVEFSERAKTELRQNFGTHFKDTADNILSMIEPFMGDMTIWDRAGIDMRQAVSDGDLTELFTADGVKKLEELLQKAKDDSKLGQDLIDMAQNQVGTFEFHLDKDFDIKNFDFEKMENFHQTATKYLNAKSLKQRVEMLEKGIKEVKTLYKNALAKRNGVPNSDKLNSDYDKKFMEVLTEYFNGDDGVATAFFNSMKEGLETGTKDQNEENNVLLTILDRIQKATNQTLNESLQGEKFENLESRYKAEFKDVYGREDDTTEVENIIQTGQEIGGTIKIGAMTTIQILISAMTMGTGNAALIAVMNNPLVSYLNAVGTDYALSIAGALSSQNGLTSEKHEQIVQGTVETAKFIGVGSLSAPLCRFVGQTMSKHTGKLFEGGNKVVSGNITSTTISGEHLLQNICTKSANFAGSFGTELGVFTGYEVAMNDEDFNDAMGAQSSMLSQLKVVNKFLQTALGKFVQTQASKGQAKLAEQQYQKFLQDTGLDKASITQYETPTGTRFTGEINGAKFTGTTAEEVQGKLLVAAARQFEGINKGVNNGVNEGGEGSVVRQPAQETNPNKVLQMKNPDGKDVLEAYANREYPYYDDFGYGVEFSKESGAKTLKKSKLPKNENIIEVANDFKPFGTVAATSELNQTLITSGMVQCSAISIVDKANNKQTLIHLFPGHSVEDNRQVIEHCLAGSNPENLEISLISGYDYKAPRTVQYVLDTMSELVPNVKVNLCKFPEGCTVAVLKDGTLTGCTPDNVFERRKNITTNPEGQITYCSRGVNVGAGVKDTDNMAHRSEQTNIHANFVNKIKADAKSVTPDNTSAQKAAVAKPTSSQTDAQTPSQHIVVGKKLFELNSKLGKPTKDAIQEVKTDIEKLRQTEPEKAENLQIVLDMFTNPPLDKDVTDVQIDAVTKFLDEHYASKEEYLSEQSDILELGSVGRLGHRMKSFESTRDKISNYIDNSKEKGKNKTLLDAYNDVRDKYASRTVFKPADFTKHPEVQALIKQGKIREAILRAAELQSTPALEMLKEAMRKAKAENADLSMMRISNYTSENGIPIFSEGQLAELKDVGALLELDVSFIKLADELDPKRDKMIVDGATTKAQPSGYTALQINFATKTGEIIEWQFRGELVHEFAEAEHLPYDLRTGKRPWAQYPELESIYKPIADLLKEKVMPKYAYDQLNRYFTDYYTHLRKLELGFESEEPKLENYENWTAKDENGVNQNYTYKFDKRLEAKNLIEVHRYAEGIKDGLVTPERAVVELNRIVAENSKQKENTNHEKAENNNINFSSFTEFLKESNSSYQIEIDKDGNKIIRIVSERNKQTNGGIEFKYNVYKFDSNGNLASDFENQTEAEIRNKFGKLKRIQIVDASGTNDNSTVLYSGIPVFALKNPIKGVKNYLRKKEVLKYFENNKKAQQQTEYLLDRLMKNGVDLTDKFYGWTEYDIKICLSMANNCNNPIRCLDLIADIQAGDTKNENKTMYHCIKHFLRHTQNYTKPNFGINEDAFLNVLQGIKDNNFSDEQLYAIFNKGYDSKYWYYRDIPQLFTTQMWEHLANIMPALKELSPEQIVQLDIYNLIQMTNINRFNALKTTDKQNILKGIEGIPENVKQKMVDSGFDIKGIELMLKGTTRTTGYAVRTDKTAQKQFEKSFIVSEPKLDNSANQNLTSAETTIGSSQFREFLNTYSDAGIPLKYSRTEFINDLNNLLEKLPENERANVLKELNITLSKNSFTGFIKLNPFKTENYSQSSQTILKQIRECADNFAKNNEVKCSNPQIKSILDDIVKGFPEFTSIMGRIDADHSNKLEIHILQTLNEAINNPKYKLLTNEEKKILKFAILLHDMGKAEGIGGEHATQSVVYARSILSKFNLNETMKNSIVNLVKYHHFTDGSQSFDFRDLFRSDSERKVAVLMAESDYSARFGGTLNTDRYSYWQNKSGDNFNIWDKNTFRKPGNRIQTENNTHIAQLASKHKYMLPNGQTVEIPVMDMRNAKSDEPASIYGWSNGKTLGETVSQVHNCTNIEDVRTVLEAQLDPNMDMDLSTRARVITDRDGEYGMYQLVLSSPDSNIGGVYADNVGSGGKKGLGNFISSRYEKGQSYKSGLELANAWMNEIHVLNPKVEQIAILADISPEQVPIDIVELSHKFKVPIIILGSRKR